jgi:hypothetical protein
LVSWERTETTGVDRCSPTGIPGRAGGGDVGAEVVRCRRTAPNRGENAHDPPSLLRVPVAIAICRSMPHAFSPLIWFSELGRILKL